MATILTIIGGTAGFLAALIALAFFSAPLLSALAIWVGTGLAFTAAGLARALIPHANPAEPQQELA
jgi:hypothetical protein